jgi:hypothetical protein
VESVAVDLRKGKMTVIGDADPMLLTIKLRKFSFTELLSVGPAKEEKKESKKVYMYLLKILQSFLAVLMN